MDDVDLTRDIETREESYALSAAAELIADEYHDDSDGGEWTPRSAGLFARRGLPDGTGSSASRRPRTRLQSLRWSGARSVGPR